MRTAGRVPRVRGPLHWLILSQGRVCQSGRHWWRHTNSHYTNPYSSHPHSTNPHSAHPSRYYQIFFIYHAMLVELAYLNNAFKNLIPYHLKILYNNVTFFFSPKNKVLKKNIFHKKKFHYNYFFFYVYIEFFIYIFFNMILILILLFHILVTRPVTPTPTPPPARDMCLSAGIKEQYFSKAGDQYCKKFCLNRKMIY